MVSVCLYDLRTIATIIINFSECQTQENITVTQHGPKLWLLVTRKQMELALFPTITQL